MRRILNYDISLVTEREIIKTGTLVLKANENHDHKFWTWIIKIEFIFKKQIW
jgi:hypothetical protein